MRPAYSTAAVVAAQQFQGEKLLKKRSIFTLLLLTASLLPGCGSGRFNPPDNHPPVAQDDRLSMLEDDTLMLAPVLSNDSDPDGTPLRIASVGQPESGQVFNLGDQRFAYQPQKDFSGQDHFSYLVTDGYHLIPAQVSIDVQNVADAPELQPAADIVGLRNGSVLLSPMLLDVRDPDSDIKQTTISLTQAPAHGSLILNGRAMFEGETFSYEAVLQGQLSYLHTDSQASLDNMVLDAWDTDGISGQNVTLTFQLADLDRKGEVIEIVRQSPLDEPVFIPYSLFSQSILSQPVSPSIPITVSAPKLGVLQQDRLGNLTYIPNTAVPGVENLQLVRQDSEGKLQYGLITISLILPN